MMKLKEGRVKRIKFKSSSKSRNSPKIWSRIISEWSSKKDLIVVIKSRKIKIWLGRFLCKIVVHYIIKHVLRNWINRANCCFRISLLSLRSKFYDQLLFKIKGVDRLSRKENKLNKISELDKKLEFWLERVKKLRR